MWVHVEFLLPTYMVHQESFGWNFENKSNCHGNYYSVSYEVFLMIMRYVCN